MKKTIIEIDYDIVPTLYAWHGGQWDPVYAVASSLGSGNEASLTKEIIGDAINNLERDYDKATWASKKEKKELKYAIQVLNEWYDSMPEEDEDFNEEELEELTVWEP